MEIRKPHASWQVFAMTPREYDTRQRKVNKSEGTRKVEYGCNFWSCADAVYPKLSKSVHAWQNYSLPNLDRFLKHNVVAWLFTRGRNVMVFPDRLLRWERFVQNHQWKRNLAIASRSPCKLRTQSHNSTEMTFKGHSRSSEITRFDTAHMTSHCLP